MNATSRVKGIPVCERSGSVRAWRLGMGRMVPAGTDKNIQPVASARNTVATHATCSHPVAEAVVFSNDFANRRDRPSLPWATSTR
ncbi:hypothetical protein Pme01_34540 [Planosporangium mesophilum]|uniref:Uncharacterized protein n=1 Tax=Planosporangium mesophilum TaxID=689768 RepID=A0A8J3X106_9ACTN|nr:hypothetical protein Pme01_34540 [Planosporangium mesophilum]